VLAEANGDGIAVVAAVAEAMDTTEGVVLMLGRQRPGLSAEVVQLCNGLLCRGALSMLLPMVAVYGGFDDRRCIKLC
jgi:hypothetical protein